MAGDSEVVRALLDKGANPNINDMGLTPFLVAAGVGAGNRGGTGLAAQTSAGGPVNMEVMELLLQHGANVNAQVTGTLTYSMRVSRAPSANEGKTALHIAAETGKTDLVRYLLNKGAKTDLTDAGGQRAIDLVSDTGRTGSAPPADRSVNPASAAEIRSLLENAASKK
jgi:ankyrin repeat protein